MVIADWTLHVADLILEQSNVGRTKVASIITENSPFKVGIAYMPVPRCEVCIEWLNRNGDDGYCDHIAAHTKRDFGCVDWKAK